MKHINIYLAELDNPAVAQIFNSYSIDIDLNQCKLEARYQNRNFIQMVARVINHEILHYAIAEITDTETSVKFDKIAPDLKEYWGW